MSYEIIQSDWLPNWYVLTPGDGCTCVEGSFDEWNAIAEAIKANDVKLLTGAGGRRCACRRSGDYFYFYSPRNATDEVDGVLMDLQEANTFADSILAQFGHGEGI